MIKKDGKFYAGYCLEIPQARGTGKYKIRGNRGHKKGNQTLQVLFAEKAQKYRLVII